MNRIKLSSLYIFLCKVNHFFYILFSISAFFTFATFLVII